MRAGEQIANEELGIADGARVALGAVVRRTQMHADEKGWTQMDPPIYTDCRRFFV